MKILLTLFVLLFSSSVFAEDISDFQIEGMSIGDSLLDYYNEDDIKKNKDYFYQSNKYYNFGSNSNLQVYDAIQFNLKDKDKKYLIYGISGKLLFIDNFEDCNTKKNQIAKEISNFFINDEVFKYSGSKNHRYDKTGKSKISSINFSFTNGDNISIYCTDWSEELKYYDNLKVNISKNELVDWFKNEAY